MSSNTVMDDSVKIIVNASSFLIILEVLIRIYSDNDQHEYWIIGGIMFAISYISCILAGTIGMKDNFTIIKTNEFKSFMNYLRCLDGVSAFIIGISIYYKSTIGLLIGILIITKFSLICLLNRLILGRISSDSSALDEIQQTTKSFLHHVASFLFIQHPLEIIITTIWRTIRYRNYYNYIIVIFIQYYNKYVKSLIIGSENVS